MLSKRVMASLILGAAVIAPLAGPSPVDAQPQTPLPPLVYYKIDVLIVFPSPDEIEVSINKTVFGDAADFLNRAIEETGEEAYISGVSEYVKNLIGDRTIITGTYDFTLSGDPEVSVSHGTDPINWTKTMIRFRLAGSVRDETTLHAPTYRTVGARFYSLYTSPLVLTAENLSVVVPIDTLNLTMKMPEGFRLFTGGPRPTYYTYERGPSGLPRLVFNWLVRNPSYEGRGQDPPFGEFMIILMKFTDDGLEKLNRLEDLVRAAENSPQAADPYVRELIAKGLRALREGAFLGSPPEELDVTEELSSLEIETPGGLPLPWVVSAILSVLFVVLALWIRRSAG